MKRSSIVLIIVIVLVVLVGGGYALFHKSSKPASSASSSNSTQSAPAVNNAVLITKTDPNLGQYLADPSGKPLYTFGGDSSGVSNCAGSCLSSWPAYLAKGSTSNLPSGVSTIKRADDGQTQYTYNGLPLYYFITDKAGQMPTGNGVENFKLAKPAASSNSTSSTSNSTNSTQSNTSSSGSSSGYNY
jgi:predicted lipoprotein with Yx(FWY)xxD motif